MAVEGRFLGPSRPRTHAAWVRDDGFVSHLPRPLTQHERSVLDAMLSVVDGPLLQGIDDTLVVDECDCGCPTIYFTDDVEHWPVAEAYTAIERGEEVTLFANEDKLWGLEWVGRPDPPPAEFPNPNDLTVWRPLQ
jgi:hypothetical protein